MDFASLFARSTPFRRLVAATAAAGALALLLGTVGAVVPATLDGLLADLTQRGKSASVDSVRVVSLPNGASGAGLSRGDLARLHSRLVRAGAVAVVLQVPLSTPEAPRDLAQVRGMLDALGANRDPALTARLRNWAQELDHDALLEQSLRQAGRGVVAAFDHDAEHGGGGAAPESTPLQPLPGLDAVDAPALPTVEAPLGRFAAVAMAAALPPAHIDGDGARRHEALYFETPAGPVPSVPLAAWLLAKGIAPENLTGGESLVGNSTGTLRLAGDATWLPRYGNANALNRTTAAAWLESTDAPTNVGGKVVVVCPRSPAEATPAGRHLSRCDGTALRIASLLAGDYMLQPFWGTLLAVLLWVAVVAFVALACPTLPTGGRIAAGAGLAVGITGLELWLLAEHNTVAPLMSAVLALVCLAPWVWRIEAPVRPVAESILAAEGTPFGQTRRQGDTRPAPFPRKPAPALTPVPSPRSTHQEAAEAARSSRLGLELPPDHVPGRGLPGVESVPAVQPVPAPAPTPTVALATQKLPASPRPAASPAPAPAGGANRQLKPVPVPANQQGATSLRAISEQLSSRMVDPATTDVADLLLGRIKRPPKPKLGRYELDRELGRGAMGTVYVARDPQINRVVALKAIPLSDEANESDSNDLKTRFFREAEMAGRLAHPRIVTVYDAGEDRGIAFIAMEFLSGRTLGDFTSPDRRLSDAEVFEVTARVAEGLDYAHQQGVIHRDIKPGNIIYDASTGSTKITDFGIARVTNSASTRTGVVLGTPSFMSPEQLEGKPLQGTSDLFSLGVTLFQLLTGQLPFRADSMTALMDKIANAAHPPLETLRPDLPPAAALVIDHALEKDPSRRFQSGKEMADALRHCAALLAQRTATFEPGNTHGG